ncbi:MAG TPA: sigma-70 family RNA polymerase sigma factor [Gemmataceae bacterium]|nr:sigma-70 family RNA polymerase sigma factor [Gemmataceae bacterium]
MSAALTALIARCRVLCRPRSQAADAELLSRFAQQRDAAAFEDLLERHAALVWGVCRRIVANEADCEDAFQATFLALVRRAAAIDARPSLGAWLHTVAVRVARKTLARSRRQRPQANLPEPATAGDVADEVGSRELFRIVDEEIERLPAAVRAPLILCCLEGRTRDEAAAVLGCSVAAVKGRLERGRDLLRQRLQRRGVELPAAFLVLGLTATRIRAALWAKTMQSALYTPAPAIVALAEAGVSAAMIGKCKLILAALLLVSSAAGVAGTLLMEKPAPAPASPQTKPAATESKKPETPQVRRDRHGDPLPEGAIARLGTVRWRHGVFVHALAYSPDGKRIVTAGIGRALVLWDAASGKELPVFPSRGQILHAAFSPDGKVIAITKGAGQLWDAASGKMLRELKVKGVQFRVMALAFAPDGKLLATANTDNAVHLWDAESGDEKHRIDCQQGDRLWAVAFAPDGKLLASGGSDGTIRLWDAVTYKEVRRMATNKKAIRSLVFSPSGKWLASRSLQGDSPRLWDVATGREIRRFGDKQGASGPLAFSPDGKLLASGYWDGTFRLWDAASGEEKRHWRGGAGPALGLAFSPDGKTLASAACWGGGIRLWEVATGRERHSSEGHRGLITLLRFSADKKTLLSGGFDRNVLCWDVVTQTPRRQLTWTRESCCAIYTITEDRCYLNMKGGYALSPDGNTLAAGSYNADEVWLWDVRTGKATKLPGLSGKDALHLQDVAFSPDGRLLASGGLDEAIHIWDVRQGKEVRQIEKSNRGNGLRLLFSPDGKTLACGTLGQATLHLWDVASGKERRVLDNQWDGIRPEAFSPDGKVLAAVTEPSQKQETLVRLFDMTTGKELCRHSGHRAGIGAVAFSPDGKLVASGGSDDEDNSIHVWEAATGRLIRRFVGHHSWVSAVTFAADGLTVASSAGDSTILLWDITGRQKDGKLRPALLSPRQLEACWTAMANEDAAKAYDAVWALVAAPEQAVALLQKHLPLVPRPDAKTVARLIADLDSDNFMVRQKATEELSKLGDAIAPTLRQELAGKPSLEVRRRIQQLLDQSRDWTTERLRDHRAIQALEHIGTNPAREVLRALAEGASKAQRTEEAKAALRRLSGK